MEVFAHSLETFITNDRRRCWHTESGVLQLRPNHQSLENSRNAQKKKTRLSINVNIFDALRSMPYKISFLLHSPYDVNFQSSSFISAWKTDMRVLGNRALLLVAYTSEKRSYTKEVEITSETLLLFFNEFLAWTIECCLASQRHKCQNDCGIQFEVNSISNEIVHAPQRFSFLRLHQWVQFKVSRFGRR